MNDSKDLTYSIIHLIICIPTLFLNVWFFKEIWNIGLLSIFISLPILTYKSAFLFYCIKSIFGLSYRYPCGYYINSLLIKKYSYIQTNLCTTIGCTIGLLISWVIVTKILI